MQLLVWIVILPAYTVVCNLNRKFMHCKWTGIWCKPWLHLDSIWRLGFLSYKPNFDTKNLKKNPVIHHCEHFFWHQSIESPKFMSDSKSCFNHNAFSMYVLQTKFYFKKCLKNGISIWNYISISLSGLQSLGLRQIAKKCSLDNVHHFQFKTILVTPFSFYVCIYFYIYN